MLRDFSTPQTSNRKYIERTSLPPPPPPPDAVEEFFSNVVLGESDGEEEEEEVSKNDDMDLDNNPVIEMEIEIIPRDSPPKPEKRKKYVSMVAILTSVVVILILSVLIITKKPNDDDNNDVSYRVDIYYGGRSCLFNHIHPTVPVNYGSFSNVEFLKIGQIKEDSNSDFKVKLVSVTNQTAIVQVAFNMEDMKEFCNSLWTVSAKVDSNEYGNFSLSKTCQQKDQHNECSRIDHHVSLKVTGS